MKDKLTDNNINIYDEEIAAIKEYIRQYGQESIKELPTDKHWEVTSNEGLVLRNEMAYELGGKTLPAVGLTACTTTKGCVDKDGIYLIGSDLPDISKDTAYARITFIRLKECVAASSPQELYGILRAVDYVRYHNYPKGYMTRISAIKEREPVRVAKEALAEGMTFSHIGSELIRAYKQRKEVAAVQIYFITDENADYEKLKSTAERIEQITDSMNHIFNGLIMDCSTCGSRELCDEIDGLRQLHHNMTETE